MIGRLLCHIGMHRWVAANFVLKPMDWRPNRDQIIIEAGRELDALVAEKVMGWHAEAPT